MPSRARLTWNGDALIARVEEAAMAAIDDTTRATDDVATNAHWWRNRTGDYGERHIVTEQAVVEDDRVRGRVGATYSGQKGVRSFFYALFLEYKLPWLRPAADITFPTLAERIRRRLAR
jgi:hypothetical protein